MSCSVLTQDRLRRLLEGALEPAAKEVLARHFEAPCEACLDRLQVTDPGKLLLALAGPAAVLSGAERDALFERAMGEAPTFTELSRFEKLGQRFPVRYRVAAALIALVLLGMAPMLINRPAPRSDANTVHLKLRSFEVGTDVPARRALGASARISSRDQLVFEVELDRPAHLYLWVVTKGQAALAFAPEAADPPLTAGAHELTRDGHSVALEPSRLADQGRLTVVAVASPERLSHPESIDPRSRELALACERCSAAQLELELH